MSLGRRLWSVAVLSIAMAGACGPSLAQAPKPVLIADGECGASCTAASPAVYQCLADEMTSDLVKHSQFYGAVTLLQTRPTPTAVERFFNAVSRTPCKADQYRLSVDSLGAILTQHPFVGRELDLQGMLVKDRNTGALRLQTPDYREFWTVEQASVDPAWVGQQVAFHAVVTGAARVKAMGARKTQDEDQVYIQCLATGFTDRKLYLSETFLGSKKAMAETEARYGAFIRARYPGVFVQMSESRCEYKVFAEQAAELHAFTSKNNASRLVLTGWKGG